MLGGFIFMYNNRKVKEFKTRVERDFNGEVFTFDIIIKYDYRELPYTVVDIYMVENVTTGQSTLISSYQADEFMPFDSESIYEEGQSTVPTTPEEFIESINESITFAINKHFNVQKELDFLSQVEELLKGE